MRNDHELKLKFTADTADASRNIGTLTKSHTELMRSARAPADRRSDPPPAPPS